VVEILVYLDQVHVLHHLLLPQRPLPKPLLASRQFRESADGAALQVENHLGVGFAFELDGILHYHYIKRGEIVGLDSKHSIDPSQQRLVLRLLNMIDVVVKHVEQD